MCKHETDERYRPVRFEKGEEVEQALLDPFRAPGDDLKVASSSVPVVAKLAAKGSVYDIHRRK
jgi:hypothetical protein